MDPTLETQAPDQAPDWLNGITPDQPPEFDDANPFDDMIRVYKKLRAERDSLDGALKEFKEEWTPRVLAQGSYKCAAGAITVTKGSRRVNYDAKIVDSVRATLRAVIPDLAKVLDDARKEIQTEPTWSVK
jgi:hypothetical protein